MVSLLSLVSFTVEAYGAGMFDETGRFAGSYLCVGSASGGIKFEAASKKWVPATFNVSDSKFVVAVRSGSIKEIPVFGMRVQAMQYQISIRPFGSDGRGCGVSSRMLELDIEPPRLSIFPSGRVQCSSSLEDYDFNFGDLRYLRVYPVGFIDGQDNDRNTPNIEIGTCSRID
ncbi:MAG: hypothetical protein E5W13_03095 [Mesorhizobium sp.]|nr:MAG: hypothetical protein E5W13_03095 [Mesorhizobium sp.]